MISKVKLILCFVLFLLDKPALSQVNEKLLDSYLTELSQSGKFNGNILLADKGNVVYQKSFGLANEDTKELLTLDHVFELSSVSKQFTAMGILILQQKNKIALDDEISKYIPELKFYPPITIKNLLHHTSGLPEYLLLDSLFDKSKINDNNDLINLYVKYKPKLDFVPNSKHSYSNTNYSFLATIIEKASGVTFGDFLDKAIFKPLEMSHTMVHRKRYAPKEIKLYTQNYIYSESLRRNIIPDSLEKYKRVIYMDGIQGDGVVNSTLGDLLKWDRALYTNKLVSKEIIDEIFTPTPLSESADFEYGYGWRIQSKTNFGKLVFHRGDWAGYSSYIERHIDNDKTIIVLSNTDKSIHPYGVLQRALYSLPIADESMKKVEYLEKFVGNYQINPQALFKIYLSNSQLMAQGPEDNPLPIYPEAENIFYFEKFRGVQLEFVKDERGNVSKFIIRNSKNITEVIKI
jgi:CubicO group peptidase (beta-lactamase class C family)